MSMDTNVLLEPKVGRIFQPNGAPENTDTPVDRTITGGATDPSPVDLISIADPRLFGLPIFVENAGGTATTGSITIDYILIVDGIEVERRTETTGFTGSSLPRGLIRQAGTSAHDPDNKFPFLYAPTMKIQSQVTANTMDGTMVARISEFDRVPVVGDV